MNKVIDKIPALVEEELEAANVLHTRFHSAHEGWAVLKEEVDEARDAMLDLTVFCDELWVDVKNGGVDADHDMARNIEKAAVQLAAEAVQVAAMARKFQALEPGVWDGEKP